VTLPTYISTHHLVTAQQVAEAFGVRVRVAREMLANERGLVASKRGKFGRMLWGVRE